MIGKRKSLAGVALGAVWSIAVVWVGANVIEPPVFTLVPALAMSLATPGLTLVLFFVVAAIRNFVRKADNSDSEPASDYRTMPEAQAGFVLLVAVVSALSLWPASAYIAPGDGLGAVIAMSVAFPIAALIFLLGAKYRAGFAAFGQTAMLMPSLLSLIWSVAVWVT